jgi:hypothetical protein
MRLSSRLRRLEQAGLPPPAAPTDARWDVIHRYVEESEAHRKRRQAELDAAMAVSDPELRERAVAEWHRAEALEQESLQELIRVELPRMKAMKAAWRPLGQA